MLHHGFTAAERTRHRRHTAFGDGEQCVDDPLAGDQRMVGRQLFFVWTPHTHRPFLHHGQRMLAALVVAYDRHRFGNGELAVLDRGDLSAHPGGNHNALLHNGGFLHGTDDVAGHHRVARFHRGDKVPLGFTVQRGYFHTALQIVAHRLHDRFQRALNTVENAADQTGSQFHAQRRVGGFHRFAGSQPGGFFIYLNGRAVTVHFDDLADQTMLADAHNIKHIGVAHSFGDDQRPSHFYNGAFAHNCLP